MQCLIGKSHNYKKFPRKLLQNTLFALCYEQISPKICCKLVAERENERRRTAWKGHEKSFSLVPGHFHVDFSKHSVPAPSATGERKESPWIVAKVTEHAYECSSYNLPRASGGSSAAGATQCFMPPWSASRRSARYSDARSAPKCTARLPHEETPPPQQCTATITNKKNATRYGAMFTFRTNENNFTTPMTFTYLTIKRNCRLISVNFNCCARPFSIDDWLGCFFCFRCAVFTRRVP